MSEPAASPINARGSDLSGDIEAARAFMRLSGGWWRGPSARTAWLWTLSLAFAILLSVGVNVGMNAWNGWFFNALEKKDAAVAGMAMATLPLIVLAAAGAGVLILKTRETLQVHWRQWFSAKLIEPANPEYRIADDVRWATEPLVDFAIGLLSAVITVITFVGILWTIGGSLTVGSGSSAITIPAYLVLAAIVYGLAVTTLMLVVGRRLPQLYARRNESEARFRFGLMRLRDSADAIAIGGGQVSERTAIGETYGTLATRWLNVIRERVKLTWITNGNGALVPVVPLMLAAPKYLSGEMSLGGVVQVAAAFVQVQFAFNWLLENFMRIAEWLASARRVNELAEAINRLEDLPPEQWHGPRQIAGAQGRLSVHELVVNDRDGRALAPPVSFEAAAGETWHLGSVGNEGASALLRAIAEQWAWGTGVVVRAPDATVGAAAARMRWAETRLAALLPIAGIANAPDRASLEAALVRVGLGRLVTRLDETADWDKVLTEGERQRLALARLHVMRPDIVLIDNALYALDEADAAALFADLRAELADSIIVSAGNSAVLEAAATAVVGPLQRQQSAGPGEPRRRAPRQGPARQTTAS
jgi:vitamin B12/bleomycin/antimicrobial peptide transport system ATP-binding/permease protein